MLSHIGEEPYRCDFCDEPFRKDKELIRYMPYYAGGKPYKGISCDKTLSIGNKFIIHVPPHTGEKPYLRFNFSGSILCIKMILLYAYHRKLERNIIDATYVTGPSVIKSDVEYICHPILGRDHTSAT